MLKKSYLRPPSIACVSGKRADFGDSGEDPSEEEIYCKSREQISGRGPLPGSYLKLRRTILLLRGNSSPDCHKKGKEKAFV